MPPVPGGIVGFERKKRGAAHRAPAACVELRIQRVMLAPEILLDGNPNRIDPDKWRPLIMSFQHFYGLGERVHDSRLASIPETLYRGPDIDKARLVPALDCGMGIAVWQPTCPNGQVGAGTRNSPGTGGVSRSSVNQGAVL